jgi:ribosomal protein L37AE/L43A
MAMNRVQFQRGMSLSAFQARYGSETLCEQAVEQSRWPKGFCCPKCSKTGYRRFRRHTRLYLECLECGHQTSLIAGTLFAASKLSLTVWFQAIYLLMQTKNNVAALELKRHLGVCYRTAWRVKHKLMQAMSAHEDTRQLSGVIQIDDAYLGGERMGGKAGRGSENKQAFVIAVSTTSNDRPLHVVIRAVSGFTMDAMKQFYKRHVTPESDIHSDGLSSFAVAERLQLAHSVLRSSSPRMSAKNPAMRWVNTVLSNVKRSLDGTYHAIKFKKYAQRYLNEAAWRFNRRFDLANLAKCFLTHAIHSPPNPEKRLRTVLPCGY